MILSKIIFGIYQKWWNPQIYTKIDTLWNLICSYNYINTKIIGFKQGSISESGSNFGSTLKSEFRLIKKKDLVGKFM
jgi:hypothetical protein